jgi:hypothetical protein
MTVLKEGAGGIWHIYDKDTGKGKRVVVRTSHSVQSSKTLKAWQAYFAQQAHAGNITKAAKEECIKKAEAEAAKDPTALQRYFRVYNKEKNIKICKMSVLRLFMREALTAVAKSPNRPPESKRSEAAAAAAAEIRGIEF